MASAIDGGNHTGIGGDEEDGESYGYLYLWRGDGMCHCVREIVKIEDKKITVDFSQFQLCSNVPRFVLHLGALRYQAFHQCHSFRNGELPPQQWY